MTTTSPIQFGRDLSLAPTGVVSIPKKELKVINTDPHNQKEKCLISVPTSRGETMWVHLDIVKSQQWTTVTNRKSKGKARASSSNVVSISTRETEKDVASLTSSRGEKYTFTADVDSPPTLKTRFVKPYVKQYGELMINSSQPAKEVIEQSTKPSAKKQKELRYVKAL